MKSLKRSLPVLMIAALSLAVWGMDLHHYFSFDLLKKHYKNLENFINLSPYLSSALYMGIYIAIVALSIPGAAFMTIVGGILFGQFAGTGLVVLSATLGATLLFISVKYASEDFLSRKAGPWINKMKAGFQQDAFYYLLTLRLIPIFPFVAINLVAAIFQIPLRTFFVGTFVGIIPGSFVYVSIGNALKDVMSSSQLTSKIILEPKLMLALTGLGLLSLLPVIYKRLHRR